MDSCGGQLVVSVDAAKCLVIYPLSEWEEVERKLMSLPNSNKKVRQLQRFFIGQASEVEMNAQGRFVVPEPLREFAGLTKQAVLVGQGNKFELWCADSWNEKFNTWVAESEEEDDEDISELMGSISF